MDEFSVFDFLMAPVSRPFAIALGMLCGLLVLEIVTLLAGMPLSSKVDALLNLDLQAPDLQGPDLHGPDVSVSDHGGHGGLDLSHEPGMFGTAWDWLNAGRVPLLILVMIMLAGFGGLGYMIEGVAHVVFGWLPTWLAALASLLLTIPVTRRASLLVSRVVPRDESYAVEAASLVGHTGIIVTGPLAADTLARVKVKDTHGNQHFPWVRTKDPNLRLSNGDHVLLVEQAGNEYLAVAADPKLIG